MAKKQSAGRGRLGRAFASDIPAGLYCTIIVESVDPATDAGRLVLLASLSLRQAVVEQAGFSPTIVWPNDLYGSRGKISGILVERIESDRSAVLLLGIGVNLVAEPADFPPELQGIASSLSMETGTTVNRDEFLQTLLEQFAHNSRLFSEGNSEPLAARYAAATGLVGQRVNAKWRDEQVTGVCKNLSPLSGLTLETTAGMRTLKPEFLHSVSRIACQGRSV